MRETVVAQTQAGEDSERGSALPLNTHPRARHGPPRAGRERRVCRGRAWTECGNRHRRGPCATIPTHAGLQPPAPRAVCALAASGSLSSPTRRAGPGTAELPARRTPGMPTPTPDSAAYRARPTTDRWSPRPFPAAGGPLLRPGDGRQRAKGRCAGVSGRTSRAVRRSLPGDNPAWRATDTRSVGTVGPADRSALARGDPTLPPQPRGRLHGPRVTPDIDVPVHTPT